MSPFGWIAVSVVLVACIVVIILLAVWAETSPIEEDEEDTVPGVLKSDWYD